MTEQGNVVHPVMREPFDPDRKPGARPSLPGRVVLSFPLSSQVHDMWAAGMRLAAEQRGLAFDLAIAHSDTAVQIEQVERFLAEGIGGLEIDAIEIDAVRQVKQAAVDAGIVVCGSAAGPTSIRVQPDFYLGGQSLGRQAAEWISNELDGTATVVHFTHGQFGPVARDRGVEDAVTAVGPGVKYIEIAPAKDLESKGGSHQLTTELLEEYPDVDVWLGPDRMMVGTLAALEDAGRADDRRLFVGGFDGHEEALARISEGTAYRASIGLPIPLVGYATGQFMADWLEGKNVPQMLCGAPTVLTSAAEVDEFRQRCLSLEDLPRAFASLSEYAVVAGNISYDTRAHFIAEDF